VKPQAVADRFPHRSRRTMPAAVHCAEPSAPGGGSAAVRRRLADGSARALLQDPAPGRAEGGSVFRIRRMIGWDRPFEEGATAVAHQREGQRDLGTVGEHEAAVERRVSGALRSEGRGPRLPGEGQQHHLGGARRTRRLHKRDRSPRQFGRRARKRRGDHEPGHAEPIERAEPPHEQRQTVPPPALPAQGGSLDADRARAAVARAELLDRAVVEQRAHREQHGPRQAAVVLPHIDDPPARGAGLCGIEDLARRAEVPILVIRVDAGEARDRQDAEPPVVSHGRGRAGPRDIGLCRGGGLHGRRETAVAPARGETQAAQCGVGIGGSFGRAQHGELLRERLVPFGGADVVAALQPGERPVDDPFAQLRRFGIGEAHRGLDLDRPLPVAMDPADPVGAELSAHRLGRPSLGPVDGPVLETGRPGVVRRHFDGGSRVGVEIVLHRLQFARGDGRRVSVVEHRRRGRRQPSRNGEPAEVLGDAQRQNRDLDRRAARRLDARRLRRRRSRLARRRARRGRLRRIPRIGASGDSPDQQERAQQDAGSGVKVSHGSSLAAVDGFRRILSRPTKPVRGLVHVVVPDSELPARNAAAGAPARKARAEPTSWSIGTLGSGVVPPAGFEPATNGLEGRCSIH
uniref:Glycosyltransferase n=1 Tax=Parastrongyloides trichosuri TaxID=131310 RepID=A0A0N4ZZU7_PARTI